MFHGIIMLIEREYNFAHSVSLTFLPAMFAPVKASEGSGSTKRNQSEVGKRKRVRDLRREQKEREGGMFSKNTYVLRNCTRKKEGTGEEKHMRESG